MNVPKLLGDAAALLKERGLCKGTYEDDRGHLCALGALSSVARRVKEDSWFDLVHAVEFVVSHSRGLPNWNDERDRTTDDVIIAFDAARVLALQEKGIEPEDVL